MKKTFVIADDHPFTAKGMEKVITSNPMFVVEALAKNGIEAISMIKRFQPDCAILDLSMPGANGLEVFIEAKRWAPKSKYVIITGISAAVLFEQLYDAGIDGLFVKHEDPEHIKSGLLRILDGHRVVSDEAMKAIQKVQDNDKLSKREMEVLHAIATGKNNNEIAQDLGLSPKTVDTHRTNLLRKMKVNSTAALLVASIKSGLIDI